MDNLIGSYVTYKGNTFIVTEYDGTYVRIIKPSCKRRVLFSSIKILENIKPARIVTYKDSSYIVTEKGLIISLTSHRIMKWGNENGNRIAILKL